MRYRLPFFFAFLLLTFNSCSQNDPLIGKWQPVSATVTINGKVQSVTNFNGVYLQFHSEGKYQSWDQDKPDEEGTWTRTSTHLTTLSRSLSAEDKTEKKNILKIDVVDKEKLVLTYDKEFFRTTVTYKKLP